MAEAYFSPGEILAVTAEGEDAALALDGAAIIAGRNGLCGNGIRVAAHRKLGNAHLAVAWAPSPVTAEAGPLLTSAMAAISGVCTHT